MTTTPTPQHPTAQPHLVEELTSQLWQNREEYIMFRLARQVSELTPMLEAKGRSPLRLSIGAPTVPPPALIQNKLKEALENPAMHSYSTTRGEAFFLEAIAQYMQRRFGVSLDAKAQTCSLVGSKEGLACIFRGLITPYLAAEDKEVILIPDPGYASYAEAIEGAGGKAFSVNLTPENQYLPDLETVWAEVMAAGIAPHKVKALVINYPNNPIGATAPLSYYEAAVAFAKRHNLLLISDNAYADLYFEPEAKPHSILEVAGALDVAIEFHSLSKPYSMTGWRIGFAVGNTQAIDLLALVKSTMDSGLFKAVQYAGAFALNSTEVAQHVEKINAMYAYNQSVFLKGLASLGWPVAAMNPPKATFYLWLPLPKRYTSCHQFSQELLKTSGVVTVPGTAFGPGGEGFVRLSLVLPEDQLNECIERMREDGFTYEG